MFGYHGHETCVACALPPPPLPSLPNSAPAFQAPEGEAGGDQLAFPTAGLQLGMQGRACWEEEQRACHRSQCFLRMKAAWGCQGQSVPFAQAGPYPWVDGQCASHASAGEERGSLPKGIAGCIVANQLAGPLGIPGSLPAQMCSGMVTQPQQPSLWRG